MAAFALRVCTVVHEATSPEQRVTRARDRSVTDAVSFLHEPGYGTDTIVAQLSQPAGGRYDSADAGILAPNSHTLRKKYTMRMRIRMVPRMPPPMYMQLPFGIQAEAYVGSTDGVGAVTYMRRPAHTAAGSRLTLNECGVPACSSAVLPEPVA